MNPVAGLSQAVRAAAALGIFAASPLAAQLASYPAPAVPFLPAPGSPPFNPSPSTTVFARDVNGDGRVDFVTSTINSLTVRLDDGAGSYVATLVPIQSSVAEIATSDLNVDGLADFVVVCGAASQALAALGGPAGLTLAHSVTVPLFPNSAAMNDWSGDGVPDLAIVSLLPKTVCVASNSGTAFGAPSSFGVGLGVNSVAVEDLNGDGLAEVVTGNGVSSDVSVLVNAGGAFSTVATYPATPSSHLSSVVVGDADGDGNRDVLASTFQPTGVTILRGTGTGTLSPPTSLPIPGSGAGHIAGPDLNGDGALDIVKAEGATDRMVVLLGTGGGAFGAPTAYPGAPNANEFDVADVNADGILDVISVAFEVTVLHGDGVGGLVAPSRVSVFRDPVALRLEDMNGDARLDLVVLESGSNTVSIRPGDGSGGFLPGVFKTVGFGFALEPVAVWAGDLNGDGVKDVLSAVNASNSLSVLLATAPLTFGAPPGFIALPPRPLALAVGDLNADGKLDAVTGHLHNTAAGSATAFRLLGNGAGGFGPVAPIQTPPAPVGVLGIGAIALHDMNLDGALDFVFGVDHFPGITGVALGDGAGGFGPTTSVTFGVGQATSIAAADLDVDGIPDVAVARGFDSPVVPVLRGTGGGILAPGTTLKSGSDSRGLAIADANGDGAPDVVATSTAQRAATLFYGLSGGGLPAADGDRISTGTLTGAVAAGDLNADGRVDFAFTLGHPMNEVAIFLHLPTPTAPAPFVESTSPFPIPIAAVPTPVLSIRGTGLSGASSVQLGPNVYGPGQFSAVSPHELRVTLNPPPAAIGAAPVVVVGPGGSSAAGQASIKLASQRVLLSDVATPAAGGPVTVFAAGPTPGAVPLVGVSACATGLALPPFVQFGIGGCGDLQPLSMAPFDANGISAISTNVPVGAQGAVFLQFAELDLPSVIGGVLPLPVSNVFRLQVP